MVWYKRIQIKILMLLFPIRMPMKGWVEIIDEHGPFKKFMSLKAAIDKNDNNQIGHRFILYEKDHNWTLIDFSKDKVWTVYSRFDIWSKIPKHLIFKS